MGKVGNVFSIIFSLAVVTLFGWGVVYLVVQLLGAIKASKPDANLITALVTGLVALVSVLIKQWLDRRDALRQDLRLKKIPIYERYMQMWFDLLHISRLEKSPVAKKQQVDTSSSPQQSKVNDVQQTMIDLARQLILWGSTDVIKKHVALRRIGNPMPFDKKQHAQLLILEDALKAIRKDLGHSNFGLQPGDLLILFINNDSVEGQSQDGEIANK